MVQVVMCVKPVPINLATYSGHGSLRKAVMQEDYQKEATAVEIAQMSARLSTDLEAGSLGLSTGLEYDPGIYSSTDEIIQVGRESYIPLQISQQSMGLFELCDDILSKTHTSLLFLVLASFLMPDTHLSTGELDLRWRVLPLKTSHQWCEREILPDVEQNQTGLLLCE